ncbi:MAG: pilus assembly protein PilM [Pirellulaceae bacterium]
MSKSMQTDVRQQYESKRPSAVELPESGEEGQSIVHDSITCARCQQVNPSVNRFCRSCGSALWRACAGCENERPVNEAFCAMCGASLVAFERELTQEYHARLAEIEQLVASERLWDAVLGLRALIASQNHPCLAEIRKTAVAMLDKVTARCEESQHRHAGHLERGRQLLESCQYEEAARELNAIPAGTRDEETNELLAAANAKAGEIAVCKARVRAPNSVRFEDRMASIAQLLVLQPGDPQVTRWAAQARDQIVQLAHKRLREHQYHQAVEVLRSIPEQVVDANVTAVLRQATELEFLWSEIELAPTITESTLRTAQRLLKLAPDNQRAHTQFQDMARRFQAAREASATSSLEWASCPAHPHIGLPVHAYAAPPTLLYANAETRRRFGEQPGRFCVASGLALQSVHRAQVTTNLLPARNTGVLGMLRSPIRERPAKSGWGLDLSVSGLKAVRIVLDTEGRPTIASVVQTPHRLSLAHPEAARIKKALLLETLAKFVAEHGVGSADRVAISWPAMQSFVRFLRLPAVEGKKRRDMLELETRQQIPMPLDQVTRDTFSFPLPSWASKLEQMRTLLIATRARDVEEHLGLFQQAGVDVHVVQCDALAMHNWIHFDRLAALPEETVDQRPEGCVVLDVGAETTNVLVSFRSGVWFRNVRPAADDLVSAFAQRFKLTREVAEDLVCNPGKAKRLSDVHDEACHVFQKLVIQIEGCLTEFNRNASLGMLRDMLLVGGAGPTPGLLRYLRHGR